MTRILFGLLWLLLCVKASAAAADISPPPSKLTVTSWGAAGRVSGSLHVLDTGNGRWMIDCGTFLEEETAAGRQSEAEAIQQSSVLPPGAEATTAVLATHAHLDHMDRLPLLVHRGYRGPIHLTRATAVLARVMLETQARFDSTFARQWTWSKQAREAAEGKRKSLWVHWRDCEFAKTIAAEDREHDDCVTVELLDRFDHRQPRLKASLCSACVTIEAALVHRLFQPVDYDRQVALAPGVTATFLDAGHIPGSASVLFEVTLNGRQRRVLFSGDLGNPMSPMFPGPKPAPAADAVVIEATYGDSPRTFSANEARAAFRRAVSEAVAKGGVVWIPAFALDRTQKVLYELHLAQQEETLAADLPIYCPSPTAQRATAVYREHREAGWFSEEIARDAEAWLPHTLRVTVPSAKKLPRPCIILSTNDIVRSEWMRRMLTALLPEESTAVLLVGYHDPESAASRLKEGATELELDGQRVPVRAKIRSFACFTGHGSAADIDRWLGNVPRQAKLVLVHGGWESLRARAEQLRRQGRERVFVATPGEAIDLCQ